MPENMGIALSHADNKEKMEPRSSLGTSFDVIERRAGATIGLKKFKIKISLKYFNNFLPKTSNGSSHVHHPSFSGHRKANSPHRMSTCTNRHNDRVLPLQDAIKKWHRDQHNQHKRCRLISLKIAVNLSRPIELKLRIQIKIRLLITLKGVECH